MSRLLLFFLAVFFSKEPLFAAKHPSLEKHIAHAKEYLAKNKDRFPSQKYVVLIDYSQPSSEKRFHLVELATEKIESFLVAHGKGSDPQFTGMAKSFGDTPGSHMSSLGFFKSAETYWGKHGYSLKLLGLSDSNKNALVRSIVIHAAPYVSDKRKILGRSWGCPALAPEVAKNIIDRIKDGALIYSFSK